MTANPVKILFHLHRPPLPADGGDKQRLMGMLNYFHSRQNFLLVDGFGGNLAKRREWTTADTLKLQPYLNNFQVYQGENNLFDLVYSRGKSFYYQKILREQLPIDTDYFAPPGYVQFVKQLVQQGEYDYLWLNYIEYAALGINLKKHFKTKIFIDIHDLGCQGRLVMSKLDYLQQLKFDYQKNLIKECKLLNHCDRIIVNSAQEIEILSSYIDAQKLVLIPHLLPEKINIDYQNLPSYSQRKLDYDLLFVGTGRDPNLKAMVFFLQEIFPQIVLCQPEITLALVGSINEVIEIPPQLAKNVINLGYVQDLASVYLRTKIIICPLLKGAGTKVKLQEALAYAVPIVTTTVGASGLKLEDAVNAYIADTPETFAQKILTLLEHDHLRQKFSTAAKTTFQKHYSPTKVAQILDRLWAI